MVSSIFFHVKKNVIPAQAGIQLFQSVLDPRLRDCVVITKWTLFHPVMPDPDPASSVVTLRKTTGFRVKPGMTKICIAMLFIVAQPRMLESSILNAFWMPDQVRHDGTETFYEFINF